MPRRRGNIRRTRDHIGSLASPPLRSPPIKSGSIRYNALRLVEDRRVAELKLHPEIASYLREARRLSVERVDPRREYARQEFIKRLAANKRNTLGRLGPFHFKLFDKPPVVPAHLRFNIPHQVAICIRRRIRREVMHALHPDFTRKRGRGGSRSRPAKWNEFSLIRC